MPLKWAARATGRGFLLAGGLALAAVVSRAADAPPEPLRTAEAVRSLTPEEAAARRPVRLRGVVTFNSEALYSRFIQDDTAGIYLAETNGLPALTPGQLVEVEGVTSPGEFAPVVVPTSVRVVGTGAPPRPKPVSIEQLVSGREDSQFVEVRGIVRAVQPDPATGFQAMDLVLGGERFTAYARELPVARPDDLADSTVVVRGVCSTLFNRQRQLFGFRLLVPSAADVVIERPAAAQPFDMPAQPISSLLRFAPQGTFGHRVKVAGVVVFQQPGGALFIQDATEGLYCQVRQSVPLQPGDRVEVLGFPAKGEYTPMLEDAIGRRVGAAPPPTAAAVDVDQVLTGQFDCRLVRLAARVLDRTQQGREPFLVLEAGGFIFNAYLGGDASGEGFGRLSNGSLVAVTGVCLIERGSNWQPGESWRAKSFRILLRSPRDVAVLRPPPWWTLSRVLWIAGALALIAGAASGWVAVLHRQVQRQTEEIRDRLRSEAALKQRYEDLFENANDMVYTHDRGGRLTSINRAGENLLRQPRAALLGRNLADLIAEDQRPAAREWLEQVLQGAEPPAAEWDFLNAAGQRVKLEISARLLTRPDAPPEVEGIARDVTERRRLEQELLEISNREQRRIGHDLHDGVCQQLAGIAYRMDVLGDRLAEEHAGEAAEAARIGALIHDATQQARSVARGLFPVRLEEKGLVASLEELAVGISQNYGAACRFVWPNSAPVVDAEIALHLYYIAQEAAMNAVRHGQAQQVTITLQPDADRCLLRIEDAGSGFAPAAAHGPGMGLRIMRHRARVIGATLEVKSQPGQGAQINCRFPLARREASTPLHHA